MTNEDLRLEELREMAQDLDIEDWFPATRPVRHSVDTLATGFAIQHKENIRFMLAYGLIFGQKNYIIFKEKLIIRTQQDYPQLYWSGKKLKILTTTSFKPNEKHLHDHFYNRMD